MKKYELTEETKIVDGVTLHRIRALKDFVLLGDIKISKGEFGGWIEKEANLGQTGNAWVSGNARVYGDAEVFGNAWVCGDARVCGNAQAYKPEHYLVVGPAGSRRSFTTFFRTKEREIFVSCGCFLGNLYAFLEKVKVTHGDNKYAKEYQAASELAKAHIDLSADDGEN